MARAPGLAAPTLSPFGGSGSGFGAFSIVDPGREAYLIFLKVENSWQNGQTSNDAYLAAMRVYADALPAGSSTRLNTEQRIVETTYRVQRNVLVSQIDNGTRELTDLLAFDASHMTGLNPDSETYRDRVDLYRKTQQQIFAEAEDVLVERYQDGTLTTTQLQGWYRDQAAVYGDNPDLAEAITKRIGELDDRVLDERDAFAIDDYSKGRLSDDQFLTYAHAARARYATGTGQAREWDQRIEAASTARAENGLLYRYGLSQRYAELQQFIKSNAAGAGGGTSTSTTKRIILGADGQWHTITSTSTRAIAPSAAQVAAHKELQIQIADAKRQMAEIVGQLGAVPGGGGWVSTDSMIAYYNSRQSSLVRGSADWYALQEKLDSLNQRKHAETVLSQQGIRITYPGAAGAPTTSGGGGGGSVSAPTSTARPTSTSAPTARDSVTIDSFLSSLGTVESSGRYDARNSSSGAFGKYQIMPSNWPAWAAKYLGDANAKQTPENQEAVARGKVTDLYKWLGSWDAVAYWWLNGGSKETATNPANWTTSGRGYVAKVMGGLGLSPASATGPAAIGTTTTPSTKGRVGGLTELTGVGTPLSKTGVQTLHLKASSFPTNLDGRQFEKFYAAYERAFNSGAESFVDSSSGTPIAYFIGDDPLERIERMRQMDDLRVSYYGERANAYSGTPTEITASNQYSDAVKDAAAHEYRILDTMQTGRGVGGVGYNRVNPVAAGNRLLDKTVAAMQFEIAAAQSAYDRGDFAAAYSHLQLARHYLDPSITESGPAKGEAAGTLVELAKFDNAADQMIAAITAAYSGISPTEALGTEGGGKFTKDLERLQNARGELEAALSGGDKLRSTIESQISKDQAGNVVLDRFGQPTLAEGWARFVSPSGAVEIKRLPQSGVDEKTGEMKRSPEGYVKVIVKVGTAIEDVYAKWESTTVGYIRGADGVNRPMMGKMVTVITNGQEQTMFEDPLNPGHWSSSPIVFNPPAGFRAVAGPNGTTTYQFGAGGKDDITYSLQFDTKTGTYLIVGNRPGGLLRAEIKDQPIGGAGDANVLDLLRLSGFTRDTATASGAGGFIDVTIPVFGLTPEEHQTWLNPRPATNLLNVTVPGSVRALERSDMAAERARAFAGSQNLGAARESDAADLADFRATRALRAGNAGTPAPAPSLATPADTARAALPSIRPLPVSPTKLANIAASEVRPATNPLTSTAPATTTTKPTTTTKRTTVTAVTRPAPTRTFAAAPAPAPALKTPLPISTTKLAAITKLAG